MKNLLLLLGFILIHSNIQAQTVYNIIADRTDTYDSASAAWSYSDSESYSYDANARHTATTNFIYSSGVWDKNTLSSFSFDAKGNTTNFLIQSWISYLNVWRNTSQYVSTFNDHRDQSVSLYQYWDTASNAWVNLSGNKYQKTYNAANEIIDEIDQSLNTSTQHWDNTTHSINAYNGNGLLDTVITQTWKINSWQNLGKVIFTYDNNNYLIQTINQGWDSASGNWVLFSKFADTYDASGNNLTHTEYTWNISSGTWDPNGFRYTETFAGNHLWISELAEYWNYITRKYGTYSHSTLAYDINGNRTGYEQYFNDSIYNVNNTNTNWTSGYSATYTYDANNNRTYFLNKKYNPGNHTFTPDRRTYYYYQAFNVNAVNQAKNESDVSVFPNPTTGIITIHNADENIQNIIFRNILGESMMEILKPKTSQITLDLSKFPSGTYLATFVTPNSVITKKIIRE